MNNKPKFILILLIISLIQINKIKASQKRSEFYWILNPIFYSEFKNKFKDILTL